MMNNKGLVRIFTIFVLLMVIMILALAQNKVDTSTINKAIDTLNWTTIGGNVTSSIQISADGSPNEIAKVVLNVVNKAVEFFGYTIFEIAKLAMQLARDHPDIINYKVLLWLLILSLVAPLIYPAFMIIVSIIMIVREWIANRRDKKRLKELEEKSK